MPLIDAYIKCDDIEGSYNASNAKKHNAKLELPYEGWSEVTSFDYDLDADKYPTFTIKKPIDRASNDLYILFLQNHARENKSSKSTADPKINMISLEMCRWIDINNDGVIDEFQAFLVYTFKDCRVREYQTNIDFEADDIPEESITFGFREMTMQYFHPDECVKFTWDFAELQATTK